MPEAPAPRASPDVITYFYASRMVYVAPADTYDVRPIPIYRFAQVWSEQLLTDRPFLTRQGAIDIAKESFRELKDVDRDRISLEVHVKLSKERASTMKTATAEIGRSVWPSSTIARAVRNSGNSRRVCGRPHWQDRGGTFRFSSFGR